MPETWGMRDSAQQWIMQRLWLQSLILGLALLLSYLVGGWLMSLHAAQPVLNYAIHPVAKIIQDGGLARLSAEPTGPQKSFGIFGRNIVVFLVLWAIGWIPSKGTGHLKLSSNIFYAYAVLVVVMNILVGGSVIALISLGGMISIFSVWITLVPHGVLELTAIGSAILARPLLPLQKLYVLAGGAGLLVVASILEVYVSPLLAPH